MRAAQLWINPIRVLVLAVWVIPPAAHCADRFWTNNAGGSFVGTANWLGNIVPATADNANFTNNASFQITWPGIVTNVNAFFNAGSSVITQAIGAVSWRLTNSYV